MREAERELPFLPPQAIVCGGDDPWLVSGRGFTYKGK